MKIDKTASVKMNWDSFTFPIKVGTPISEDGVLSNDEDAFGLVIRTVEKKPDAGELLRVMTGGIIDMEEVIAGYGTELTTAAMTAMSGIHVFSGGKRVNVSEESEEIAKKLDKSAVVNNLTTTEEGKVLDARQGKVLNESLGAKSSLFGSKTSFEIATTSTYPTIEDAISAILPSGNNENAYIRSFLLIGSISIPFSSNHTHVAGWMNADAKYGFVICMSYGGIYFGTRTGSNTTTWHSLYDA